MEFLFELHHSKNFSMKKIKMILAVTLIAGQLMAQTNKKLAPPPPPPLSPSTIYAELAPPPPPPPPLISTCPELPPPPPNCKEPKSTMVAPPPPPPPLPFPPPPFDKMQKVTKPGVKARSSTRHKVKNGYVNLTPPKIIACD